MRRCVHCDYFVRKRGCECPVPVWVADSARNRKIHGSSTAEECPVFRSSVPVPGALYVGTVDIITVPKSKVKTIPVLLIRVEGGWKDVARPKLIWTSPPTDKRKSVTIEYNNKKLSLRIPSLRPVSVI